MITCFIAVPVFAEFPIFIGFLSMELDIHYLFGWKVQELEKEILDSKEKIEFYRAKMQELVSVFFLMLKWCEWILFFGFFY